MVSPNGHWWLTLRREDDGYLETGFQVGQSDHQHHLVPAQAVKEDQDEEHGGTADRKQKRRKY